MTIKLNVTFAGLAVLAICAGMAGAGLVVAASAKTGLTAQANASSVLVSQMSADQAHDAIRADILREILGAQGEGGISVAEAKKELASDMDLFRKSMKESREHATDPALVAVLDGVEAPLKDYLAAADDISKTAETDVKAAKSQFPGFQDKFHDLEEAMAKASQAIDEHSAAQSAAAQSAAATGQLVMGGLLALGIAFGVAVIVAARIWLVRPINELAEDMQQLAAGRIDISLRSSQRKDELGAIGRAVRAFQDVIIQKTQSEADAADIERRRQAEAAARDAEAQAARGAEQTAVMTALADGLDRLASGDLAYRLSNSFPEAYEPLRRDFNGALSRLQETMRNLVHAVEGVQAGASEINRAADDLSRRTEQQAASLEQTAAALDEITSTVRKSAAGAGEASAAVREARDEAVSSEATVREAVAAMGAIDQSARQISQIIGVIDEIAFQTNLLALNAGVEAARAGDAGRGFAVVATEVRGLAQRSADAAKEIKSLILASGQHVERGVDLVGRAGGALEQILGRVARIAELNEQIAASSREQAVGLDEVNRAINQMDQVTQQNAAMVEETTAASHSLLNEAETLAQLAGRFRCEDGAPSPHARAA
jgi:methyl-accepting chemotaxis protein